MVRFGRRMSGKYVGVCVVVICLLVTGLAKGDRQEMQLGDSNFPISDPEWACSATESLRQQPPSTMVSKPI